jgi:hypothetical protein
MSVPGFFDIVDFGAGELGLLGYPRVPLLLTGWRQVVGCRFGVLVGCDRAPTAEGNIGHGGSGCSTIGPGQS